MAPTLLIFADSERSMDLFHAVPAPIIDPFLYLELDGRRIAVVSHVDQETVREVDPGIELLDPFGFGRKALLESGLDFLGADLEVARRAVASLGVRHATVSWDFPAALADRLRADGVEIVVDHRAFQRRRRVKTRLQLDGIRRAQHAADLAMGEAARLLRDARPGLTAQDVRGTMQALCAEHDAVLPDDVIVAVNGQAANGHDTGSGPIARPGTACSSTSGRATGPPGVFPAHPGGALLGSRRPRSGRPVFETASKGRSVRTRAPRRLRAVVASGR